MPPVHDARPPHPGARSDATAHSHLNAPRGLHPARTYATQSSRETAREGASADGAAAHRARIARRPRVTARGRASSALVARDARIARSRAVCRARDARARGRRRADDGAMRAWVGTVESRPVAESLGRGVGAPRARVGRRCRVMTGRGVPRTRSRAPNMGDRAREYEPARPTARTRDARARTRSRPRRSVGASRARVSDRHRRARVHALIVGDRSTTRCGEWEVG